MLVSFIVIQSLCKYMLTQIFTDVTTQDTHTQTPQPISSKPGDKTSKIGCAAQPVHIIYWELLFPWGGTARRNCCMSLPWQRRMRLPGMTQSDSPTARELLFCLELKAMLGRISTFISSTAWLKKWNGKSWDSLNTSWEALALSKTSS